MYVPTRFQAKDQEAIIRVIKSYPFALLVSSDLQATLLPFLLEERSEGQFVLISHLALANPQSERFLSQGTEDVLVVFQGPHAYISPSLYNHSTNVPTWNYVSAQVRGRLRPLPQKDAALRVLEKTILYFEADFMSQFRELPAEYNEVLFRELLAIEIEVKDMQAAYKLSQNKTQEEQERIAQYLCDSPLAEEQSLGQLMLSRLRKV